MIQAVESLMREVAREAILPRYRLLAAEEVFEKSPGDVVTVADRESEKLLAKGLLSLLPGSTVVGEEAVAEDPSLMDAVSGPGYVWVVDPLDGTRNFAAGREPFAMMVALLRDGVAVASWILHPLSGFVAVAERGAGARLDGALVRTPQVHREPTQLRGPVGRYVPPEIRAKIMLGRSAVGEVLPGHDCAGLEYPAVVRDDQQFGFFWRTLPWDHAAGTLLLEEAGGVARRLDGTPYRVGVRQHGLLVAQSDEMWHTVRSTLFAHI